MDLKKALMRRKYFIFSNIISIISGVVIGYSLLAIPVVSGILTWMGASVSFSLVVNLFWGVLKEARQIEREPSFKLENPRVEHHNIGTEDAFKDLYFDIRNERKGEAQDCRIDINVKGVWDESATLRPNFPSDVTTFNINPKDRKTIRFCQVTKKHSVFHIHTMPQKYPLLNTGKHYTIELQIFGKNITEVKSHPLKLDVSTWDNIGITLD